MNHGPDGNRNPRPVLAVTPREAPKHVISLHLHGAGEGHLKSPALRGRVEHEGQRLHDHVHAAWPLDDRLVRRVDLADVGDGSRDRHGGPEVWNGDGREVQVVRGPRRGLADGDDVAGGAAGKLLVVTGVDVVDESRVGRLVGVYVSAAEVERVGGFPGDALRRYREATAVGGGGFNVPEEAAGG